MKSLKKASFATLAIFLLCAGPAMAEQHPVLTQQPAADAAILLQAPDFQRLEYVTVTGRASGHNEGVIIRQSYIEDGKIHIPPSGVFYTNRGPRSYHMRGDILNILGKPYYLVYYDTQGQVISNVTMAPGDGMVVLGDKYFTLTSIYADGGGHYMPSASFLLIRAAGWSEDAGLLNKVPSSQDRFDYVPTGLPTGLYDVSPDFRFDRYNWTTDFPSLYSMMLKGGELTAETAQVEEAIYMGPKLVYISETPPITGYYSAGEKVEAGGFVVEVTSLDEAAGTVGLKITDAAGKVTEGVIGPMPDIPLTALLNSELEQHQMMIQDPDFKIQVEMSPHRRTGLWREGEVALNVWVDIERMDTGRPWLKDENWIYRPDT